jgi:hypothetical protein
MNYKQFRQEWKDSMVYKPAEFDVEQTINDYYTEYKEALEHYCNGMSVKEWCEFFFADIDLDTHPYMLKEKALKTKHGNSLREMANEFRNRVGLPPFPLIDG